MTAQEGGTQGPYPGRARFQPWEAEVRAVGEVENVHRAHCCTPTELPRLEVVVRVPLINFSYAFGRGR